MAAQYPRPLRPKERDLLEAVLPDSADGYRAYRVLLSELTVIGEGRRGEGNLILGRAGDVPETAAPLPPVVAYGAVEGTRDRYTVTVREFAGGQLDVEIVSMHGEAIPDHFEEKRRWTYSTWTPGSPSPATGAMPREVAVDEKCVLVLVPGEKRIWIHDRESGMNLLIPITNLYNELMLHKRIRDPRVALRSDRFFDELDRYADDDLRAAFAAYNAVRRRVHLTQVPHTARPEPFWKRIVRSATGGKYHG
jgi:hypothetical protein